ncbi:hypothetical protein AKJ16_DCAP16980 [Drosera capensis]
MARVLTSSGKGDGRRKAKATGIERLGKHGQRLRIAHEILTQDQRDSATDFPDRMASRCRYLCLQIRLSKVQSEEFDSLNYGASRCSRIWL